MSKKTAGAAPDQNQNQPDLLEKAEAGIEKGLEKSAEFYESKVKPAALSVAKKIADQFKPDQVVENVNRAEEGLARFLKSRWAILLGALIALRPLIFGAPVLLAAVFLYFLSKGKPQEAVTKRLFRFTIISILAGLALRLAFLVILLLGAVLIPDFISLRLG